MTKSNLKKISYHVIAVTLSFLRYYVTEKHNQSNVTKLFHFGPLPIKILATLVFLGKYG